MNTQEQTPIAQPSTEQPPHAEVSTQSSSFKKKKYIFIIVALILLITGILVWTFTARNNAELKPPTQVQRSIPTITRIPTKTTETGPPLTQAEQAAIVDDVKPALDKVITIDYTVKQVKRYDQDWAIIQITNPTTDPAYVVVKKENTAWVIKQQPGTFFDEDELRAMGAPEKLIAEINRGF